MVVASIKLKPRYEADLPESKSKMTGAPSGAETAYSSRTPEFILVT
jgi:hypothetical protein